VSSLLTITKRREEKMSRGWSTNLPHVEEDDEYPKVQPVPMDQESPPPKKKPGCSVRKQGFI
jgi:hypothetical protein